MGQASSKKGFLAKARSDAIDQQILEDSMRYRKECKVLLLGLGGSGKRTLVKQMKIHHGGFDARELAEYRTMIYKNVLSYARTLARVVHRIGVGTLEKRERAYAAQLLAAFPMACGVGEALEVGVDPVLLTRLDEQERTVLTPALADAIWHVAKCLLEHPTNFYSMDNALYFFTSIHRIAAPMYVPSDEDILRARTMSTATIETRFSMGSLPIRIFDVSGLCSERRKWIHCFESVTSIIFCTALSDYDQPSLEQLAASRLHESLCLFESVINSRWFLRTSVILLLNKIDVFKRKLLEIPLERYFPEYVGGNDLQKAARFILWKFLRENRARLMVYPHLTQATDTNNIRLVFAAVKETILNNALKDSGIL
ncbi:heterotrimeric G-protein alpha subunit, GPA3-like protein [Mycena latifolia]|nr:heterotrimeric G-protein alpha subunit, GPA3-like protein [Mycena latifolia]